MIVGQIGVNEGAGASGPSAHVVGAFSEPSQRLDVAERNRRFQVRTALKYGQVQDRTTRLALLPTGRWPDSTCNDDRTVSGASGEVSTCAEATMRSLSVTDLPPSQHARVHDKIDTDDRISADPVNAESRR